jgi:hypothetical protein
VIPPALAVGTAILALAGCHAASGGRATAAGAASPALPSPAEAGRHSVESEAPSPDPFRVRGDRDLTDNIPGCPRQNPQQRPRGSNCFGVFPEQCGADRAAAFQRQPLTPDNRARIEAIAPPGGIRFIAPGQVVTSDLRFGRLNIVLDASGVIEEADCF